MTNIIKYNNQQINFPTPIVEIKSNNVYSNKALGTQEEITLKGQITGKFADLQISQVSLINIFSKNFKTFQILEKNTSNIYDIIYERQNIQVKDISFNESTYSNIVDYSIGLITSNLKSNVLNPKNDFNFQINKDQSINLTHSISAIGISNNSIKSNGLKNAIDYINSMTGLKDLPAYKDINFYQISSKEIINRLQSSYSIEETYLGDISPYKTSSGINRYTVDISSGVKDLFLKINLQGQMTLPSSGNVENAKNLINPSSIVSDAYSGYFNPVPISYNFQQDSQQNIFNYSFEFDNINLPNPFVRYNISEQYDNIYKTINKNVSAEILARGHQLTRLNSGELMMNLINLSGIVGAGFKMISSEKTFNRDKNIFVVTANFTNKNIPGGYSEGKYTISYDIPVQVIKPHLGLRGYILQDFQTTTFPKTRIQGDFKGTPGNKPGVGSSAEYITNTESYDPLTKNFSYSVEYYGGYTGTIRI